MDANTLNLSQLADRLEAEAFESMYKSAPLAFQNELLLSVHTLADATLLTAEKVPISFLNRAIGLGHERYIAKSEIQAITRHYVSRRIASFWVHVTPGPHSNNIVNLLLDEGYRIPERKTWAKFYRNTVTPISVLNTFEVRLAESGDVFLLAEIICKAFDMPTTWTIWFCQVMSQPQWKGIVAIHEGKVIGGGLLYVNGPYAWLGAGAVLPEARGKLAHRAILSRRIEEARKMGCTHIFTETGEPIGDEPNPSLKNIISCGFEKLCSRLNFEYQM